MKIDNQKIEEAYSLVKASRMASTITGIRLTSVEEYMFELIESIYSTLENIPKKSECPLGSIDRYNAC